jgi:hypothetical protein
VSTALNKTTSRNFEELIAELELELKRLDRGHFSDAIASLKAFVEETFW